MRLYAQKEKKEHKRKKSKKKGKQKKVKQKSKETSRAAHQRAFKNREHGVREVEVASACAKKKERDQCANDVFI